ncbi:polyphenol oxidase family protein [Psychrobacter sp. H8-1]|uniref:polyphenol oxidase family protein n=1 Tax=Psychrobacter sp. H8-1 TaxID=2774129 RepID=UPI001919D211|nr:polyphenol oxidase family protein [Psychrobacter sp. H8-1]
MMDRLPINVLAQIDDVTVFQTAALLVDADASKAAEEEIQTMLHPGQTSYGELNLGLHVYDDASQVLNNRMRLLAAINQQLSRQSDTESGLSSCPYSGRSINSLHWVNQVHGNQIHGLDNTVLGMRPMDADAMISQQPGVGLAIMTADCVPIVLYQPMTGQIAAIHAGWQGLACGVIKTTAARFDLSASIMAWIGVCISQDNYEVGAAVRDQLLNGCIENKLLSASDIDRFDQLFCVPSDAEPASNNGAATDIDTLPETAYNLSNTAKVDTSKIKLDLPKLAAYQLANIGVEVATDVPQHCSYGDAHYYSYRRQTHLKQSATGRMALVIVRSRANASII